MNDRFPLDLSGHAPVAANESRESRRPHNLQTRATHLWQQAPLRDVGPERVARGLAWFSIGLGLAELLAPRTVARLCGLAGNPTSLIRLYGLREIASGVLIFAQGHRPATGVWTRVAGDALDLATLSAAAALPRTNRRALTVAATNVIAITALDVLCARELSRKSGTMTDDGAIRVTLSIAINRSPSDIYAYWREFENLPRFMRHLQEVRRTGPLTSHWVTSGPGHTRIEWDAELTDDRPNELLAWRSCPGADVENAGTVHFEPRPGERGTIVRVELQYCPPGGIVGAGLAAVFNESPKQQLYDDLHRLKQILETGEVVRSDGSPNGMGTIKQRPAQPNDSVDALPVAAATGIAPQDLSLSSNLRG